MYGDTLNECIDTIFESKGDLTCRFNKYLNCASTKVDTFSIKGDTIKIYISSKDGERLTCDCYHEIFLRIKNISIEPKHIMVNNELVGTRQPDIDAKEL